MARAALLGLFVALGAPTGVEAATPDTQAIREFWKTLDTVWNDGDADSFSELFTQDGSFRFPDREQGFEGRAEIRRYFAELFPTIADGIEHVTRVHQVYFVTSNVRVIDGAVEVVRAAQGAAEAVVLRRFFITAVMLETEAGWRIRTLRAVQVAGLAPVQQPPVDAPPVDDESEASWIVSVTR